MLGDLKAKNLCFGCDNTDKDQVYLVNFDTLSHSMTRCLKSHKDNMHKGSIKYISRDVHQVNDFKISITVIYSYLVYLFKREYKHSVETLKIWLTLYLNGVVVNFHGRNSIQGTKSSVQNIISWETSTLYSKIAL